MNWKKWDETTYVCLKPNTTFTIQPFKNFFIVRYRSENLKLRKCFNTIEEAHSFIEELIK